MMNKLYLEIHTIDFYVNTVTPNNIKPSIVLALGIGTPHSNSIDSLHNSGSTSSFVSLASAILMQLEKIWYKYIYFEDQATFVLGKMI